MYDYVKHNVICTSKTRNYKEMLHPQKKIAIILQKIQGDKLIMVVTIGKKNVIGRPRLKLIITCHPEFVMKIL